MGNSQSAPTSLTALNKVFDSATGNKYAAGRENVSTTATDAATTDPARSRPGSSSGSVNGSSNRRSGKKGRRMRGEVLVGLFSGNRRGGATGGVGTGGHNKRPPPPAAAPPKPIPKPPASASSKFQKIVQKVVVNNSEQTQRHVGGGKINGKLITSTRPPPRDTRSTFQKMVNNVIESNGGAASTSGSAKAGEGSFAKLVGTLVGLKNSFRTKEVEDEHMLRAKNLKAKYHRNVDAAPMAKEKDPFAEIKDGSVQRLALRQFSSKFKIQKEINDERMQSNADFFRANSTRSLAAGGLSGRNLNNNMSMRGMGARDPSMRGPHLSLGSGMTGTSTRSNAAFLREPSGRSAAGGGGRFGMGMSNKDLSGASGGGVSSRDLNRVPSMRAGRSMKDLQMMSNPSFKDIPRAPSLRESFQRSNSTIKKTDIVAALDDDGDGEFIDAATLANTQKNKKRRKPPNLNISVRDDDEAPAPVMVVSSGLPKKRGGGLKLDNSLINDMSSTFASGLDVGGGGGGQVGMYGGGAGGGDGGMRPMTPSAEGIYVSESGTVHAGDWKIRESGMTYNGPGAGGMNMDFDVPRPKNAARSSRKLDFMEIGTLGSGASGSVLEALHIPTMSLVAMKMLPVYQADKLQSIARELSVLYTNLSQLSLINGSLDAEDSSAAMMADGASVKKKSKHVLALYDAFTDLNSGYVHLVVEYMDGGSLEDIVNSGGCQDENVLADLSYQAMDGLSFLHENNQIHRDVKPGNILLNSVGEVKIADFGITKVMDANVDKARSFVGTMCYMAPERISSDEYSYNSDVWSLGLSILAVLRGEFPLAQEAKDTGYWGLLKVICDDEPPSPGSTYSNRFNEFIKECLTRDPTARKLPVALLESDPFLLKGKEVNKKITQRQQAEEHLRRKKYAAEFCSNPNLDNIDEGSGSNSSPVLINKISSDKYNNDDSEYNINDASDPSLDVLTDIPKLSGGSSGNLVKSCTQGSVDETEQRDFFDAKPLRDKPGGGVLLVKTSNSHRAGNRDISVEDDGKSPFDFPEELGPGASPLSILGSYKPWQVQRKGSKNSTAFNALRGGGSTSSLFNAPQASPSLSKVHVSNTVDGDVNPAIDASPTLASGGSVHHTTDDTGGNSNSSCADDVVAFDSPASPSGSNQHRDRDKIGDVEDESKDASSSSSPHSSKRSTKAAALSVAVEMENKDKPDPPTQSPLVSSRGGAKRGSRGNASGKPPAPMLSKRRQSKGGSIGGSKSIIPVVINKDNSENDMSALMPSAQDSEFANAVDGLREEHLLCILECLEDKCRIEEYTAEENKYNDTLALQTGSMSMDAGDDLDVMGAGMFAANSGSRLPVMLPSTTGAGLSKWRHLAAQLLLPVDLVVRMAKMIISDRYFTNEDAIDEEFFQDM